MRYVRLGRAGVKVSRVALGTGRLGSGVPEETSIQIIHRALELGINFIDTADIYGGGASEIAVGKALQGRRDEVVLGTKFKIDTDDGPNGQGASRYRIMRQVERSLKRLQTDYIDLYQIHRPDGECEIDETLRAMDDLVRQGKVRYIGCSNFDAWRIMEALWVSDRMNLERFVANQPRYNMLDRHVEQEILPACKKFGLATLCYSPLEGGMLTGKYLGGTQAGYRLTGEELLDPKRQAQLHKVAQFKTIADRLGVSLANLAIAWLIHRGEDVIPILGASRPGQLDENIQALELTLDQEILQQIEAINPSPFFDFTLR